MQDRDGNELGEFLRAADSARGSDVPVISEPLSALPTVRRSLDNHAQSRLIVLKGVAVVP
jgi:hypothetical protein